MMKFVQNEICLFPQVAAVSAPRSARAATVTTETPRTARTTTSAPTTATSGWWTKTIAQTDSCSTRSSMSAIGSQKSTVTTDTNDLYKMCSKNINLHFKMKKNLKIKTSD